jgi:succinate dehydrogenase / fumarate reductase, flavoprotein subunit
VFGKRAGIAAAEFSTTAPLQEMPEDATVPVVATIERLRDHAEGERVSDIRRELQETMDANAQVFRTEESLTTALADIADLRRRYRGASIQDKGRRFNTDLMEGLELGFLIDLAEIVVVGALARQESRGGHFREDFPDRDDERFMRHTMAYQRTTPTGDVHVDLDYKPVTLTRYQPMERKY